MPIVSIEVNGVVKTPEIDPSCWISESAWIVGDVKMGPDNVVYQGVIIRGDFTEVKIGAKNVFQDCCIINTAQGYKTDIGDNNLIGFSAIIHGASIKNNTVIGVRSVLMIAVTVENDAMVGATSFVGMGKEIPENQKWIGRELKGENTQGKIWEAGRQSWREMGLNMKNQQEKP